MSEKLSHGQWRRRQFLSFGIFALAGVAIWRTWSWVRYGPRSNGAPVPLRAILDANERVNGLLKSPGHLAPTFPVAQAVKNFRTNGTAGSHGPMDHGSWRLRAWRGTGQLALTMEDLRALPKTEICFEFKCIEGWSDITHWAGVSFGDLARHYRLGTRSGEAPDIEKPDDLMAYASLETPDGGYYVGIDMYSALHPQTILAYEHNGQALSEGHGAPLRLIVPTKYGVKNLKRIGTLGFSDERPRDYWYERGYDYDCAL